MTAWFQLKTLLYLKLGKFFLWILSFIPILTKQLSSVPPMPLEKSSENTVFKKADIVFLKPSPKYRPELDYPMINTTYEIDCKIVDVMSKYIASHRDENGKVVYVNQTTYQLITGKGHWTPRLTGDLLIPAKDRPMYNKTGYCTAKVDTELFQMDTIFTLNGDWYSNEEIGVHIHVSRFQSIMNLFHFHKSPLR